MKESSSAYLPRDRLEAIVKDSPLPAQSVGSVLFADISGFTPLTEAYERELGSRHGGEELTRVLNEVYADLIDEVDRVRGSVIGFAGDAITCCLDKDDGSRAVSCALAMQKVMQRFDAIQAPGGETISLGLKAAVTTGKVRRFVVGDKGIQKVDVLAGDPVYRVAEVESMANRGEVLIDDATRRGLEMFIEIVDERPMENGENAWVVESLSLDPSIEPWPSLSPVEVAREIIDPWIIAAIRERLNSGMGDFLTELRPATAMFVRFGGIDFESDTKAASKLDSFFSKVQRIVNDLDGVVHQLTLGDKGSFLYAAFGAPVSHEDDTPRTLTAALEIRDLATSLDFIESIQIGLGRGSTRSGAYGGPTRRTFGVLGDQVNLAARLMGKAENGQILISDSTARDSTRGYKLKKLDPIMVKGKSEPVVVHSLLMKSRHYDVNDELDDYDLPMVGRQQQLDLIKQKIELATTRIGQAVTIIADTGMGKTRLASEAIRFAKASGYRVLKGECQTFGTNTVYTPWRRVWRDFFNLKGGESIEEAEEMLNTRLAQINPELALRTPVLGPVLDLPLQDNELTRTFTRKIRRASLEGLLVECLRFASDERPLIIVLEDVHAIDNVSRDLLRVVIQAMAKLPVMILIVMRPNESLKLLGNAEKSLDYTYKVELAEFTDEESAELIRLKFEQIYGSDAQLNPSVVSRISQRTGGNPFFIDEVMNWIEQESIDVSSAEALDSADLPTSLHALVLSRMDQLEESTRVTMKVASVIGRNFRAAIIWGAYPYIGERTEVLELLSKLEKEEFTVRDESEQSLAYLFKHVVIHEVAYESLPMRLRYRLHEAIGSYIEKHLSASSLAVLDLLAFHFGHSENEEKQRKYFVLAGDAARRAYSNDSAINNYNSAIPLLKEVERIPVFRNLGKVHEFSGNWDKAMENYQLALELAEANSMPLEAADCGLLIGDMQRKTGAFEQAQDWLGKARRMFESLNNDTGLGQVLHSEGTLAAQSGDYDKARELYTRSMQIREQIGDRGKVASLLSNMGIICRFQGDIEEALALQNKSLQLRRELADMWAVGNSLNNLGMAKKYSGDLDGARADLEESVKTLKKVGDRAEIANTLNSLAEVALDQQDYVACDAFLQESLSVSREIGNLRGIAFIFEAFASSACFKLNPERALTLFGAASQLRESIGAPLPESDQERINELITLSRGACASEEADKFFDGGRTMKLTRALDIAAS